MPIKTLTTAHGFRVGKTALKKSLLGEDNPLTTSPTEGVDATTFCWATQVIKNIF